MTLGQYRLFLGVGHSALGRPWRDRLDPAGLAQAEALAAHYLQRRGLTIVTRNFRTRQGEIDLIARKGGVLGIFPEGTRNKGDVPQPFKSGIYHLAKRFPQVEFIPVYLENLSRIMPKGEFWPVPLACTARFGKPFYLQEGEDKDDFLERARQGVISARAPHVASN